jgi:hypothetical protein
MVALEFGEEEASKKQASSVGGGVNNNGGQPHVPTIRWGAQSTFWGNISNGAVDAINSREANAVNFSFVVGAAINVAMV